MRRYAMSSILLHWTMALAIGGAWLIGQLLEEFPRAERAGPQAAHVLLGLGVAALLLPRLLARLLGGAPATAGPEWERRLAAAAHGLLYLLMLAVPLSGLAIAVTGRAPLQVFGLFSVPNLMPDRSLHGVFEEVHEVLSNLMLGAVALHVAATLWHALVRRDGVLRHMMPGGAR
ncbi:cytochrome b [Falsiroseomonas bella]|uniref:Cytochrome b n=1 Tax=Falsiroseomonas bella TaxID=2184016 RepID=A0A317FFY1_9PROT|nr:cytochrome b/b6 domain-containing protein [Falsiroseomonas bella]PWS37981.1 cytochrome b [Falsiroseomonas bella]